MKGKQVASKYRELQQHVCNQLEAADDGSKFKSDFWKSDLGEGVTMVFSSGSAIEKAAVNFSEVSGLVSENMRKSLKIESGDSFFATGISSIIHPENPHVPITHMNVRYFQLDSGLAWFGGGIDLTPHYVDVEEAAWFHNELKNICLEFDSGYYSRFKKWADDYFFLPHRNETRGIGGVFFDHLVVEDDSHFEKLFEFTKALTEAYPKIYMELLNKNRNRNYSEEEKAWQHLRRGRYVEFNLLYDRGTKFGLDSGGRTESIFLSMPPMASWEYQNQPAVDSEEYTTLQLLKKDIDWINKGER